MNYLGIDFGLKKVGIALGNSKLAFPYRVIRYDSQDRLIEQIRKIVKDEKIDKIVVGISEGQMRMKSEEFAKKISADLHDETLSTKDAQMLSIQAGHSRVKRKRNEDSFAATLILQSYLDKHNS